MKARSNITELYIILMSSEPGLFLANKMKIAPEQKKICLLVIYDAFRMYVLRIYLIHQCYI